MSADLSALVYIAGIIVFFFVLIGGAAGLIVWHGNRELKAEQKAMEGKPFCGCGHHRAMHDPATNECHEQAKDDDERRCPCRQYVGPEPLPSYYAPEIGSGE